VVIANKQTSPLKSGFVQPYVVEGSHITLTSQDSKRALIPSPARVFKQKQQEILFVNPVPVSDTTQVQNSVDSQYLTKQDKLNSSEKKVEKKHSNFHKISVAVVKPSKRRTSVFGEKHNKDLPGVLQAPTSRKMTNNLEDPGTALIKVRNDTEFMTAGFNSFDQSGNPAEL
jgi:hypothetical protein